MQLDLAHELDRSTPCGTLVAGNDLWDVYVFGASRIGRDWYIQLALVGPQFRTVTAKVGTTRSGGEAARRVVRSLRAWLASSDDGSHGFIDADSCASTGPLHHLT